MPRVCTWGCFKVKREKDQPKPTLRDSQGPNAGIQPFAQVFYVFNAHLDATSEEVNIYFFGEVTPIVKKSERSINSPENSNNYSRKFPSIFYDRYLRISENLIFRSQRKLRITYCENFNSKHSFCFQSNRKFDEISHY